VVARLAEHGVVCARAAVRVSLNVPQCYLPQGPGRVCVACDFITWRPKVLTRRKGVRLCLAAFAAIVLGAALAGAGEARASSLTAGQVLEAAKEIGRSSVGEGVPASVSTSGGVWIDSGQAFLAVCDFAHRWRGSGAMPAQVDIAPAMGPVAPFSAQSEDEARHLDVQELLDLCPAASSAARRLGKLPIGLWVGPQRLSSCEFLVALCVAVMEAQASGSWPKTIVLPKVKFAGRGGAFGSLPSRGGRADGVAIAVNGEKNGQLSGVVEITVSARRAGGMVELCIDGKVRAASNKLPLSFRWDTREEKEGEHVLLVRAASKGQEIVELAKRGLVVRNLS